MALTREEIIDEIMNEFGIMKEWEKLDLANEYNDKNHYEHIYKNSFETLSNLLNDSLTSYFELLSNTKHYAFPSNDSYPQDQFVCLNGEGWYQSYDEIEDIIDLRQFAEWIYDHFDEYEDNFTATAQYIEDAKDLDEMEEDIEE